MCVDLLGDPLGFWRIWLRSWDATLGSAVPCADPLLLLFIDFFCVSELAMMFAFLVTWVCSMHVNKSAEASFRATPSIKGD